MGSPASLPVQRQSPAARPSLLPDRASMTLGDDLVLAKRRSKARLYVEAWTKGMRWERGRVGVAAASSKQGAESSRKRWANRSCSSVLFVAKLHLPSLVLYVVVLAVVVCR